MYERAHARLLRREGIRIMDEKVAIAAYKPKCVCLFCAKTVPLEKTEEAFAEHEPNCEWVKHTRTNWEHWGKDGRK